VHFEQYADAVVLRSGHQLDVTRALLEIGLHRLLNPLLASGQLDQKTFDELCGVVEGTEAVSSVAALVSIYRNVVSDVERAVLGAVSARQSRSTVRARRFMREHLHEPITLPQVARVAGFAPNYFSRILRREEGLTFERYLRQLRLEYAKRTLTGTSLSVARVAELSGMRRTYFQRAFRLYAGATPTEYRRRSANRSR
jgi:YesN/AraC family two-component response regulator